MDASTPGTPTNQPIVRCHRSIKEERKAKQAAKRNNLSQNLLYKFAAANESATDDTFTDDVGAAMDTGDG